MEGREDNKKQDGFEIGCSQINKFGFSQPKTNILKNKLEQAKINFQYQLTTNYAIEKIYFTNLCDCLRKDFEDEFQDKYFDKYISYLNMLLKDPLFPISNSIKEKLLETLNNFNLEISTKTGTIFAADGKPRSAKHIKQDASKPKSPLAHFVSRNDVLKSLDENNLQAFPYSRKNLEDFKKTFKHELLKPNIPTDKFNILSNNLYTYYHEIFLADALDEYIAYLKNIATVISKIPSNTINIKYLNQEIGAAYLILAHELINKDKKYQDKIIFCLYQAQDYSYMISKNDQNYLDKNEIEPYTSVALPLYSYDLKYAVLLSLIFCAVDDQEKFKATIKSIFSFENTSTVDADKDIETYRLDLKARLENNEVLTLIDSLIQQFKKMQNSSQNSMNEESDEVDANALDLLDVEAPEEIINYFNCHIYVYDDKKKLINRICTQNINAPIARVYLLSDASSKLAKTYYTCFIPTNLLSSLSSSFWNFSAF